jgi:hypothetical protein
MKSKIEKIQNCKTVLSRYFEMVDSNLAEVLDHNFCRLDISYILREMLFIKCLRPNLTKYCCHIILDFASDNIVSDQSIKSMAFDYLQLNGFSMNQYITFRLLDSQHLNLRIVVNRITFEGKVVTDSNDYYRSEAVLTHLQNAYKFIR